MIEAATSAQPAASAPAASAPAASTPVASTTAASPASTGASDTFHTVLSALNPLQYLPVVGTIYRAATGDEVSEPIRRVGSAIGSFLMGGPIGLGLNLAGLGAEKLLGIDFDKTAQSILGGGSGAATPPSANTEPTPSGTQPWSAAQLAAYGVSTQDGGDLMRGDVLGADVLNTLELARVQNQSNIAWGSTLSVAA